MTELAELASSASANSESATCRMLLCRILDIESGTGFGDLTVRCIARGEGDVEVFDLMFVEVDVQLLASVLTQTLVAASASGRLLVWHSAVCAQRHLCRSGKTGSGPSADS